MKTHGDCGGGGEEGGLAVGATDSINFFFFLNQVFQVLLVFIVCRGSLYLQHYDKDCLKFVFTNSVYQNNISTLIPFLFLNVRVFGAAAL